MMNDISSILCDHYDCLRGAIVDWIKSTYRSRVSISGTYVVFSNCKGVTVSLYINSEFVETSYGDRILYSSPLFFEDFKDIIDNFNRYYISY